MSQPSPWLRGPVEGIVMHLQPAAHTLIASKEEVIAAANDLSVRELWTMPGGAASVGFHLRHMTGSIERLLTYSRGESLDDAGRQRMAAEQVVGNPPADSASLLAEVQAAIETALEAYRGTDATRLAEHRAIGRAALPTTLLGVLAHVADHTQRHAGQVISTAKIVRGLGLGADTRMSVSRG